jgi:PAS domain S-box-containing protein
MRQGEKDLDCLRSAFRDSPEAMCIIDRAMRVVVWNQAAAEITGYSASETLGKLCYVKGNDLRLEPFSKPRLVPQSKLSSVQQSPHQKESGHGTWLNLTATVIPLRHRNFSFLIHIPRQSPLYSDLLKQLQAIFDRRAAGEEVSAPLGGSGSIHSILTRREMEILRLLAAGKKPKEIARDLSVSLTTVRTHIRNVHRKLGVKTSLEAVVRFFEAKDEQKRVPSQALSRTPASGLDNRKVLTFD